jgi:hypothetical protein
MVTGAAVDFVASAWLVAVTCTFAGEGKSAGAVYTPSVVIVPTVEFPPGTPETLQETLVSLVLVTVAMKVCVFPKINEALFGEILT